MLKWIDSVEQWRLRKIAKRRLAEPLTLFCRVVCPVCRTSGDVLKAHVYWTVKCRACGAQMQPANTGRRVA